MTLSSQQRLRVGVLLAEDLLAPVYVDVCIRIPIFSRLNTFLLVKISFYFRKLLSRRFLMFFLTSEIAFSFF